MEASQLLAELKGALAEVKDGGETMVAIDALTRYLDDQAQEATSSIELRKLEYQRSLAHYDAQVKHSIEMFKSVLEAGKEALNALVLINGGAVVALLGFMGATLNKGLPALLGSALSIPILLFGSGVLAGALGFGSRYSAQACYAMQKNRVAVAFHALAVAFASIGYALFAYGIYQAFNAFSRQFAV